CKLAMSVWPDGSAAVLVRIDQWRQRLCALEPVVELQTQFACRRKIRPCSRGYDDLFDAADSRSLTGFDLCIRSNAAVVAAQLMDAESRVDLQSSTVTQLLQTLTELTPCGQAVRFTAAENACPVVTPNGPYDLRRRHRLRELGQCDQIARCRMTGTND